MHSTAGFSTLTVDGEEVPRPSVAQCRLCSHPRRDEAEALAFQGRTAQAIEGMLEGSGLTSRQIGDHIANGHLPAVLNLAGARAAAPPAPALVEAAQAVVEAQVTHLRLAHAVVNRVVERMAEGTLEPTVRDGLKALDLLSRAEEVRSSHEPTAAEYDTTVGLVMGEVRKGLSRDQYEALQRQIASNPVIRAILARDQVRLAAAWDWADPGS